MMKLVIAVAGGVLLQQLMHFYLSKIIAKYFGWLVARKSKVRQNSLVLPNCGN
jgi:hypothetical protein